MEEEVWKCPKHPSKRRRSGICPTCLYDRLIILCADCANVRPCACRANSTTSSSSCSRSVVDSVSNFMESEPSFQRSRSAAIPFLRSRFGSAREAVDVKPPESGNQSRPSFWSVFRTSDKRMMRSRSVSVEMASTAAAKATKGRGWHFPSPIKVFRQSKVSNRIHQRSPLHS